jgi:hypothetical protein
MLIYSGVPPQTGITLIHYSLKEVSSQKLIHRIKLLTGGK